MNGTRQDLYRFLLEQIEQGHRDVAGATARRFGFSRQAANTHLRELVRQGLVEASGKTRARRYSLKQRQNTTTYLLSEHPEEHVAWREFVRPLLEGISAGALSICEYGFSEMFNNAIDHSEGTMIQCAVERSPLTLELVIHDDGVGIFRKIKDNFDLEDERQAILELSKGKLTTDPKRHTGEGIFFTSRMFDKFSIVSGKLFFCHLPDDLDWLVEDVDNREGTMIDMQIGTHSERSKGEIFDRYSTDDEEYKFTVTHVPVGLVKYGDENLVSRSQARRLVSRFEQFKRVVLDFAGVDTIGQAFADEIFRVFQQQHPGIQLNRVNTSEQVQKMIRRVLGTKGDQSAS